VKDVGEPCEGEPHARFEVAAGGDQRQSAHGCAAPGASRRPSTDGVDRSVRSGKKNDLQCRAFTAVRGSRGLQQEVTFVVQDDKAVGLDVLQVKFDDERVVSDAG